jgi:hypothetical protein
MNRNAKCVEDLFEFLRSNRQGISTCCDDNLVGFVNSDEQATAYYTRYLSSYCAGLPLVLVHIDKL